jgi:hypothetical protein
LQGQSRLQGQGYCLQGNALRKHDAMLDFT